MCNKFSFHIVTEQGKDWGKVLVHTACHHELDREQPFISKYKSNLLACETIEQWDVNSGIKFTHDCGQNLSDNGKKALKEIAETEIKKLGNDYFLRKYLENNQNWGLKNCPFALPSGFTHCEGYLYLSGYNFALPSGFTHCGGYLYLSGYNFVLPSGFKSNYKGKKNV